MARKASNIWQEQGHETPLEAAAKQGSPKEKCEAIAWELGRPLTLEEERNLCKSTSQNSHQQNKLSENESAQAE